jgi:transcriptional regulator with XRE-family HTH domain
MITKRVTVYDIARRVGVSHTTVALALRNHSSVSAKRREQIQSVARDTGYPSRSLNVHALLGRQKISFIMLRRENGSHPTSLRSDFRSIWKVFQIIICVEHKNGKNWFRHGRSSAIKSQSQ